LCGIVGFLDKLGGHEQPLGRTLLTMLRALSCRGPDSTGVALYGAAEPTWSVHIPLASLTSGQEEVEQRLNPSGVTVLGAYLTLDVEPEADAAAFEQRLSQVQPAAEIVSLGHRLEILKQVGSPEQLETTYAIGQVLGTHGIGHTRLSTESRVDLSHSQPFWAHGVPDLATVHNGHITNYHKLRRLYEQRGHRFFTENDSEVIGVYLRDRLAAGLSLEDALRSSLDDFDGSFCYLAASEDRLAYVRDRFGFKPLVVAETDAFVAIATEEIALRKALGTEFVAREPAPGTMRVWGTAAPQPARAR
jgi:glutamate synthase domain-containing protein 1